MHVRPLLAIPAAAFLLVSQPAAAEEKLAWRPWSAEVFAQAKAEGRFVILDLEAVWCHWCHVMEETTYADSKVVDLLAKKYIPVRVDQDANPDLSARYGDWGWPAPIVFAADGSEIVKRRGYIPPEQMASLLDAIIQDPSPGPSVQNAGEIAPAPGLFTAEQTADLGRRFDAAFDEKNAGWGAPHKFIDTDSMDFALSEAERGDKARAQMARRTLDAARALIDPVAGGVYQYSDTDGWSSPHYEKIMWRQAQALRQYAHAFALWKEPAYRAAASDIYRYLTAVLTGPEGAFHTSQDADVDAALPGRAYYALDAAAREKLGRGPRVDTHIYARENGWAISGLAAYANATGDNAALGRALAAARWIAANRSLPGGGYKHGETDRGGPFLGDTLAMGEASLDLYAATGDRAWLAAAARAGDFIGATFRDASGGFASAAAREAAEGVFIRLAKALDEQTQTARFFNRLHRYTGGAAFREAAEHAARYAAGAALASEFPMTGALLASAELSNEPAHITIVAHKDDPDAQALHAAARALPAIYKRLDWWDKREGPPPNPDVTYPELDRAAAFACGNRICSLPVFDPRELPAAVAQMLKAASMTPGQ